MISEYRYFNASQYLFLKFSFLDKLGPTFTQLQKLKLNQSAFVIISVIGQELLAAGHYSAAVSMLEAALQIGTCSLKLRGSVFSALSSAYWGLGSIETAISYMQHDLSVAKSLGRSKHILTKEEAIYQKLHNEAVITLFIF